MKNNTPYTLVDTAGQTTAVVDVPLPRSKQPAISKPIMKSIKDIGQVCFIEKGTRYPRLQMMGGELSVNGCAAGAFYWLKKMDLKFARFETSGDGLIIDVKLQNDSTKLRFPKQIIKSVNKNFVRLAGINYVIIENLSPNRRLTSGRKRLLIKVAGNQPASGIIYFKKNNIIPLIYVKETNTFVWETSCGSGSIAYTLYSGRKLIRQPSGQILNISVSKKSITYLTKCKMLK